MKNELKINGFIAVADDEMVDVNGGHVILPTLIPVLIVVKKILDLIFR